MKDYYYLLGIKQSASKDEIKKSYRKLSIKFHPDKNDGDDFFTERFKDIQEAYEVLVNDEERTKYDSLLNANNSKENKNSGTNFNPVIDYFKSNVREFEYDQEITFSWKTINADKVYLKPFGAVNPIGSKVYKIKNFRNEHLIFELNAENSYIGRSTKSSLTLYNKTYKELFEYFKKKIKEEQSYNTNYKQKTSYGNSSYQTPYEKEVELSDNRFLQITEFKGYGKTPVKINNKEVPNGFYRLKKNDIVYEIEDSKIKMEFYIEKFQQENGSFVEIGGNRVNGITKGSPVWLNGNKAPNGQYKKGLFSKIEVYNGQII